MQTDKLPKRYARVEVEVRQETENGQITHYLESFEGLDVRFIIIKKRGSTMNRAEIAICNLKKSTVDYLTTINALAKDQEERKVIRLFAGYEGKTGLIFEGDIIRALPSAPPDVWITAQCLSGYHGNMSLCTLDLKGVISTKTICTRAAQRMGLDLQWQATSNKKIDQFKYSGNLTGIINEINDLGDVLAFQDDRALVVEDVKKPDPENGVSIPTYSFGSGLVGLPEPDLFGVKFRVLLDPALRCGQAVRLESQQIPAANGVYWIYALTHRGELRAEPFYTELNCRVYDNGN